MMAVLPGIDANDEAKTAAVFQFYTAVLSSIPALHGAAEEDDDAAPVYGSAEGGGCSMEGVEFGGAAGGNGNGSSSGKGAAVYRLPLYLDDWVDQVCSGRRVFQHITLHAPLTKEWEPNPGANHFPLLRRACHLSCALDLVLCGYKKGHSSCAAYML
jgi:hypothetical protein